MSLVASNLTPAALAMGFGVALLLSLLAVEEADRRRVAPAGRDAAE